MDRCLRPIRILLLQLLCSASVCLYTPAPPVPSQTSPPSIPAWELQSTPAIPHSPQMDCSLRIEPAVLVVRFGDPVRVNCSHSDMSVLGWVGLPTEREAAMGMFLLWTEERMTNWSPQATCFAMSDQAGNCELNLPIIVYKPPERVSVSFGGHSGPLREGHLYSLQCDVKDVAPAQYMTVAFYRDSTELQVQSSNYTEKTPVNESFTLDYNVTREDHGAQFWCEARLELGPGGPQPPPVVRSLNTTATVHFSDGQMVTPPTRSSRVHAGKPTASAQSHLGHEQHTSEVKEHDGAGHVSGSCALILSALLTIHITHCF